MQCNSNQLQECPQLAKANARIDTLEAELNFACVQLKDWYETYRTNGAMPQALEFERTRILLFKTIDTPR